MTVLFMSMQVSLPEWVRGRGLAVFLTVYFGALTAGSALWGKIASDLGVPSALYISAGCTVLGMLASWPWKLQTSATQDLTPSLHWNKPAFQEQLSGKRGPVLVSVEYQIDPRDREPFLAILQELGRERRRDGAFAWNVFESPAGDGRVLETSLLASYLEFEYARARVTKADQLLQDKAGAYLKAPPKVEFLIAAKRLRKPWLKFRGDEIQPDASGRHQHCRADPDAVVEVDDVLVVHADAAVGRRGADRGAHRRRSCRGSRPRCGRA